LKLADYNPTTKTEQPDLHFTGNETEQTSIRIGAQVIEALGLHDLTFQARLQTQ
jgi:hypothetical protein